MITSAEKSSVRDYLLAYVRRFNELVGEIDANLPWAEHLVARLDTVRAYRAKNGLAVFGFPLRNSPDKYSNSVLFLDRSGHDLARVAQQLSSNLIKVCPEWEPPFTRPSRLPDDLPKEDVEAGFFNPDLLSEASETGLHLTGMGISPMRSYREGVVETHESRVHVWSPIRRLPSGRELRQYEWLFSDFIWGVPSHLSADSGSTAASADLNVFRLAAEAGIARGEVTEDPCSAVARRLYGICDEFENLVSSPELKEAQVQAFLEQRQHHFLVAPVHQEVHPQRAIAGGRFVPDFVVRRADGDWELVEIEAPGRPIYQESGEEPSAHFTHAITQVEDWLRYVDENRDHARREDGLTGIYRPTGRVIAGRDTNLGEKAEVRFRFKRAESQRIALLTYDAVLREARAYAGTLERMQPFERS